jgi:hypothetical protein
MAFAVKSSNARAIASRLKTSPIVPLPELRGALRPVSPFHTAVRQTNQAGELLKPTNVWLATAAIFGAIVACLLIVLEVLRYFHGGRSEDWSSSLLP